MTKIWYSVPSTEINFLIEHILRYDARPDQIWLRYHEGDEEIEAHGEVRWNRVDGTTVDWLLRVPAELDQYIIDLIDANDL